MSTQVDVNMPGAVSETLLLGEPVIATFEAGDGVFQMTGTRMVFTGDREAVSLHSSVLIRDVVGVEILRRSRESRSAWWGGIGLIAAIGVWQVSSNMTVGAIAAVAVALISLALLADYWFRPGGALLAFRTPGSSVQGVVESSGLETARQFVGEFERARAAARSESSWPTASYSSF